MMSNLPAKKDFYQFGPFRFHSASGELFKENQLVAKLQPKVSETLRVFLEHRGELLKKDRLMESIWPGAFVEEVNLSRNIYELRKILGEGWIETIPRRGFRFRAEEDAAKFRTEEDAAKPRPRWLVAGLATLGAVALVGLVAAWRSHSSANQAPVQGAQTFYVYRDAASAENHFYPTGYMGDCGDIEIVEADEEKPYAGRTSIRIRYTAQGKPPNVCPYKPPCRWAGVYWQHPQNNFGADARLKGLGYNLSEFRRLRFAARADRPVTIEFKVGGIAEPYGDSLKQGRGLVARLGPEWQEFAVDLAGADLTHIIGGFAWSTNWSNAPGGVTFWVDEIRFERD